MNRFLVSMFLGAVGFGLLYGLLLLIGIWL